MVVGYAAKEPVRNWVGKTRHPPPDQAFFQRCGISEPLEIAGWSLEQEGMPVVCTAVSGAASPSYRKGLSPGLQKALAEKRPEMLRFEVSEINDLRPDQPSRTAGGQPGSR